jgi:hypothetical protein
MLLIMVGAWIACTAFFLMSHFGPRRAPSAIRPAIRWIWTGTMLVYASVTPKMVADQYGWTRIHRTIDVVGLALDTAGLICLGVGVFKVWRRSRTDRGQRRPHPRRAGQAGRLPSRQARPEAVRARHPPAGLLRIDKARIKTEENLDGKYLLRCSDLARARRAGQQIDDS